MGRLRLASIRAAPSGVSVCSTVLLWRWVLIRPDLRRTVACSLAVAGAMPRGPGQFGRRAPGRDSADDPGTGARLSEIAGQLSIQN